MAAMTFDTPATAPDIRLHILCRWALPKRQLLIYAFAVFLQTANVNQVLNQLPHRICGRFCNFCQKSSEKNFEVGKLILIKSRRIILRQSWIRKTNFFGGQPKKCFFLCLWASLQWKIKLCGFCGKIDKNRIEMESTCLEFFRPR